MFTIVAYHALLTRVHNIYYVLLVLTYFIIIIIRSLLEEYGGMIKLDKEWAKSILYRMGFTKHRANSKSKILRADFEEIKSNYCLIYSQLLRWKIYHLN